MEKKKRVKTKGVIFEDKIPHLGERLIDFFPPTEMEILHHHFKEVRDSADKVRRGIFSRHTKLAKSIEEITCKMESIQEQLLVLGNYVTSVMTALQSADLKAGKAVYQHTIPQRAPSVKRRKASPRREIINLEMDLFEKVN